MTSTGDEIIVYGRQGTTPASFLQIIDAYLATAKSHLAGTTDRALQEDRLRPY